MVSLLNPASSDPVHPPPPSRYSHGTLHSCPPPPPLPLCRYLAAAGHRMRSEGVQDGTFRPATSKKEGVLQLKTWL